MCRIILRYKIERKYNRQPGNYKEHLAQDTLKIKISLVYLDITSLVVSLVQLTYHDILEKKTKLTFHP